jgi:hypothetical protein
MNQVDEQYHDCESQSEEGCQSAARTLDIHGPVHGQLLDDSLYHKAVHPETNASESAAFGSNFEDKTVYLFL